MKIIYEVPETFRITLIRECAAGPGSQRFIKRNTPFVMHLRVPGVAAVENVELTDELFGILMNMAPADALALQKHLHPFFAMSAGMMEQITQVPKSLAVYIESPKPLLGGSPASAAQAEDNRAEQEALPYEQQDLLYRLRKRAEIRRQIPGRKSVQEGARDRMADLLDEAAGKLEKYQNMYGKIGE